MLAIDTRASTAECLVDDLPHVLLAHARDNANIQDLFLFIDCANSGEVNV